MQFRHMLFNRVKSDSGFVVKIRLLSGYAEYRESNRVAVVPVSLVIGKPVVQISKESIIKWNPPYEGDTISEEKRAEILQNVAEALRFAKCPVDLV